MLTLKKNFFPLLDLHTLRLVGQVWTNNKNNGNINNNNNIHDWKYSTINTNGQSFNPYEVYIARGYNSHYNEAIRSSAAIILRRGKTRNVLLHLS